MTNLLLKLFVKEHKNTTSPVVREAVGKLASIVSIVCNVILSVAKILVGVLFGVVSVLADGLNNLTDCGSNIIALISFKLSNKPADKEHPYGHQRMEYVSSLIVGIIVVLLAFEVATEAVNKIISPSGAELSIWTLVALGASILIKLFMYVFNNKLGKTYNSELLKATATDSMSDTIATAVVLVSVVVAHFTGFVYLDGIMGIGVSVMIALAGVRILKETLSLLLGESPNKELIQQIVSRIKKYPGIYGIHDLNVHNYGPNKYYASVHCEVDSAVPILESHDLIDQIEREFTEQTDIILVIHLDPIVIGDPELDTYREQIAQIVAEIDEHFTIHDFRMVKGPTHTNLIFDVATHFDTKMSDAEIVDYIQTGIAKLHPETNVYVVPTVEKQID